MIASDLNISDTRLVELCRRWNIRRLAVFGSALGDDFRDDSDLDLLVEFEPRHTPGLGFFQLQDELTQLFGRTVDLNTPACLSVGFRAAVVAKSEELYVAP
ncbi:MAG: nucleotidyltransferase domain-containing protein [Planctomycetaceae bacterium]|nr:nucleotidyltransferase domain-containing protein [Planctomycetaceae bacterium]